MDSYFSFFLFLGLKKLQFFLQSASYAVLGQIDLGNRDAKLSADLGRVPLPQDIIVKKSGTAWATLLL